jgi:hypothetical protein
MYLIVEECSDYSVCSSQNAVCCSLVIFCLTVLPLPDIVSFVIVCVYFVKNVMNNAKLATRGIHTLCYHSFSTFGSEGNGLDRMRNRFYSIK